ncbi:zinc ribbon domain-containing protein [Treponema primitia]|uniref:zinc ribbon domain-containing protein n=1 Tax=Treponema primitia TaxID=88058 RepID=UPI0002555491|nr:zinc ribbon domain-containing protein [Treponema primitia]
MGARFFCENCGAEVKRNSKSCPKCGRSFANILCPACGFEGEEQLFSAGCPVCGYTADSSGNTPVPKPGKPSPPKFPAGSLPLWAYVLAILAFVAVLAILLR